MCMWCVSLESIDNNVEWHSSRLDHKQDKGCREVVKCVEKRLSDLLI